MTRGRSSENASCVIWICVILAADGSVLISVEIFEGLTSRGKFGVVPTMQIIGDCCNRMNSGMPN